MDVIQNYRDAGFTDDEISDHMTQLRDRYKAAGFNDDEIDQHFGIPPTPKNVPLPVIQRAVAGTEAVKTLGELPDKGSSVTDWFQKMWDRGKPKGGMEKAVGEVERDALGDAFDVAKAAGRGFIVGFGDRPMGSWTGPPDWNQPDWKKGAQAGLTLIGMPLEGVLRTGGGIAGAAGEAGMEVLKKATGQTYDQDDVAGFLNDYLPGLIGPHAELARLERDPAGTPQIKPIDTKLPTGEVIQEASRNIGHGETTPLMEAKLGALYQQQGMHPAEVAADAARDPWIAQSILSSDAGDMPYGYQFHGYEALPETVEKGEQVAERLDASFREPYFQDPVPRNKPFKTDTPLNIDQGETPIGEYGAAKAPVGDGFELKPLREKEDLREALLLEAKEEKPSESREAILSHISTDEESIKRPWTLARVYTDFLDKLYPIYKTVKSLVDLSNLPPEQDPYVLARLLNGAAGKADHFINNGTFDSSFQNNGLSFKAILDQVKDDLNGFRSYIASSRAIELEGRGIKTGFDDDKLTAAANEVRNGQQKFEGPFRQLVDYQNRLTAYLRDSGVLSTDAYNAMVEANRMYVPFDRVMGIDGDAPHTGGSSLQAHNPIEKIRGSARMIVDPLESIIRNTYHVMEMAERNQVGLKLFDILQNTPRNLPSAIKIIENPELERADAIARAISEVGIKDPIALAEALAHGSSKDPTPGTISVMRDGRRITGKVDQELAIAVKGLDVSTASALARAFAPAASTMRAGVVLTPEFWMRHIFRDFLAAMTTFKKGVFNPIDMGRGVAGLWVEDPDYWNWMKGGGGNTTSVAFDRSWLQQDIRKLTGQTGLLRAWNVMSDPKASMWDRASAPFKETAKFLLDPLRAAVEFAENASHLGAFKKAMRLSEREEPALNMRDRIIRSAWVSRDTAVDAARMGANMRGYNMITAFANITLQDFDRVARALITDPVNTTIKMGGAITIPSVLLWMANHNDPRYKQIPPWEKNLFWHILTPSHIIRIPKPWGAGLLFGSLPERLLDHYLDENPKAFDGLFEQFWKQGLPDFLPTAAQPLVEHFANRSTFTNRTLIPSSQERFMAEYQQTPYTTELAKSLGHLIGAFPGMDKPGTIASPIIIENYISAWSGGLGMYALQAADAALRKMNILPDPPMPTATFADLPFVKAFTTRYPSASAASIQDFYDTYNDIKSRQVTWEAKAREGDIVAMKHIQSLGSDIFVKIDGMAKALSVQQAFIQAIYKNPSMPPDQKRQLIDSAYYAMILAAQQGNKVLDNIESSLRTRITIPVSPESARVTR